MNVYTNLYNAAVSLFDEIKTVSRLCFTWFFEPGVYETTRIKRLSADNYDFEIV